MLQLKRIKFDSRDKNEGGSAVLLALVLAIVVAGLLATSLDGMTEAKKQSASNRISGTRTSIENKLKLYCTLPATFRTSLNPNLPLGMNQTLSSCVLGQPGLCQAESAQPVTLFSPVQQKNAPLNEQMLAGPASTIVPEPVRLDIYGNPCSKNELSPQCPFEISATFIAKCPGGTTSCAKAQSVSISYSFASPAVSGLQIENGIYSEKNMSVAIITCPQVSIDTILPTKIGTVTNFKQVQTFTSLTTKTPTSAQPNALVLSALAKKGITDPRMTELILATATSSSQQFAIQVLDAVTSSKITDPWIQLAIASAWISDQTRAAAISAILTEAGVTKYEIQLGLVAMGDVGVPNADVARAVNSALLASQITDGGLLISLAHAGITDPNIATAIASTGITWGHNNQWIPTIAAQLAASGPMSQDAQNQLAATLLAQTLANNPAPPATTTIVSSTIDSTSMTTTSSQTADGGSESTPPAAVSLINTCSKQSCSKSIF